jgi:hypothetical protein
MIDITTLRVAATVVCFVLFIGWNVDPSRSGTSQLLQRGGERRQIGQLAMVSLSG